ncbi:MAG: FAD-binding oxidoreductase, partial [Alphaproteobacteria bacterium]|nr:FAD-binding oxidoreductase [Alphaproteobacteria bacterium]
VVVIEAGVTWAALDAALAPQGLRAAFWGTGSGLHATVGGGLSQNAANYGTGKHGFAADNVLGLKIVLADGSELMTGSWGAAINPTPFARYYGPDLTGLFVGDCGAFGIKAEAALSLVRRPGAVEYCAFEYAELDTFLAAMGRAGRAGLHAECFGFDPAYMAHRTTYAGISEDVGRLKGVITGQGSILKGVAEAVKIAAAGRRYLEGAGYTLHFTVEGRDAKDAAGALARLKGICADGGKEIPASIPKVMRGTPFPGPTIILGPRGERWIPVHGIVPHSRARATIDAIHGVFNAHAAAIERHNIAWAWVSLPIGRSGILIEPTIYWSDRRSPMQDRYLDPAYAAKNDAHALNPEARAAVAALRAAVAEAFRTVGAVHMQIGRTYDFLNRRMPAARDMMQHVKQWLDPNGMMNPGSLGLPS